jgi:hypothetical protein
MPERWRVFRSFNSGDTWVAVNSGLSNLNVRALRINPASPTTLFAGTAGCVFRTFNSGGTWTAVNSGL